MREPRNPFRLRASEHIESDTTFLRLFGPGMLDLLPVETLWEKVHIFRSAPGGGKTSMLRLFTPSVLLTLHAYQATEECQELYRKMCDLAGLDDEGPALLGVMLSAARNYAALGDMDFDPIRRNRLFFALLNARIVLAFLRGALILKRLSFPKDLELIRIEFPTNVQLPPGLSSHCSGQEMYEWAKGVEIQVCETLDSLGPPKSLSVVGHDSLFSLVAMVPGSVLHDLKPVAKRVVFMFDDVHLLTRAQRELLLQTVVELRKPTSIWLAERYEALSPEEILSPGAIKGRDYESVIFLEDYWREKPKRFESLVLNIADRRGRAAADVEVGSFEPCLQASLDGTEWQRPFARATSAVEARVKKQLAMQPQFGEWVASRERIAGTHREKAIAWRTLEILIERERRKSQRSFDFPLSSEVLEEKDDSAVKAAAELFLSEEFHLPYYFGATKLASLASSNVEQFLWLAGEEFEEVVSAALFEKTPHLSPDRQDAILRRAVKDAWEEIPRRVRLGRDVRNFLEAICSLARSETYRPNAPYAPGVIGIAISMADRQQLLDSRLGTASHFLRLREILAIALADNLLEAELDYRCKGDLWMVLNLNRFLCVQFSLPLQRGGWREQSLLDLCDWIAHGFKPQKRNSELLS